MTSMPLTSRRMEGEALICLDSSKRRKRRFEERPVGARHPYFRKTWGGSSRSSPSADHRKLPERQLWQSAEVRLVSFFSLTYLSAADFTIGLMICSSAWKKSDVIAHF